VTKSKSMLKRLAIQLGTANAAVEKKIAKLWQLCSYCKPNRGENASRKPKYGVKKSKHKNKRG